MGSRDSLIAADEDEYRIRFHRRDLTLRHRRRNQNNFKYARFVATASIPVHCQVICKIIIGPNSASAAALIP